MRCPYRVTRDVAPQLERSGAGLVNHNSWQRFSWSLRLSLHNTSIPQDNSTGMRSRVYSTEYIPQFLVLSTKFRVARMSNLYVSDRQFHGEGAPLPDTRQIPLMRIPVRDLYFCSPVVCANPSAIFHVPFSRNAGMFCRRAALERADAET